ncbi:hypothetical protein PENTCL1PPCAC_8014, partial [Pristionchus entomophagus]
SQIGSMDDGSLGLTGINLLDGASLANGDILYGLGSLGDDSDRLGNGLGGDRMVTSHHHNLDSGGSALGHGVRDGGTGRVDHGHQADESETIEGEIYVLFRLKSESLRELVLGQVEVAEAEHSFAHSSQLQVGRVEVGLVLLVHHLFFAVQKDSRASLEDPLGGSLHHQQVLLLVWHVVNGHLVLVGRIEGDLGNLGV